MTGLPRYTLSRGEVVFRDSAVQAELGRGRFIKREPFAPDARALILSGNKQAPTYAAYRWDWPIQGAHIN